MEGKVGGIIRNGVWLGEEEIRDSLEGEVNEGGAWVAFREKKRK